MKKTSGPQGFSAIIGCEYVALEALRFLGLDAKLQELGLNGAQTAAAIETIIGRACEPATHAWLQERSGLGELIDYGFAGLSLYGMYQVSDQLLGKKAVIEQHLYEREYNMASQSWANSQMTVDIYGHLVPGGNRSAVNKLDKE